MIDNLIVEVNSELSILLRKLSVRIFLKYFLFEKKIVAAIDNLFLQLYLDRNIRFGESER